MVKCNTQINAGRVRRIVEQAGKAKNDIYLQYELVAKGVVGSMKGVN